MEKLSKSSFYLFIGFSFFACKQMPSGDTGVTNPVSGVPSVEVESVQNGNGNVNENEKRSSADIGVGDFLSKDTPKKTANDYDRKEWGEILETDSMTILDIRYATENNFTEKQIYDCARCFLRPEVKKQLLGFREHMIKKYGFGIILYDCYRPRPYQQKLWDIVPDERFVGNPAKGSMHNRGMAVDIGLIDKDGNILDMGTEFDHFGQESFHSATNISKEAIKNRLLLKKELGYYGFKSITSEWWHYSYRKNVQELSDWVWECF